MTVYQGPAAIARLAQLGLTPQIVEMIVEAGEFASNTATNNHPPTAPGYFRWSQMVCVMREQTIPLGWTPSDATQLSTTVNPSGDMQLAIASGDEDTGDPTGDPKTKSARGPATVAVVEMNQLWLLPEPDPREAARRRAERPIATWFLLVRRTSTEIQCEVSLPGAMGDDGRIEEWEERIVLDPIPLGPPPADIDGGSQPTIEIDVPRRRKSG